VPVSTSGIVGKWRACVDERHRRQVACVPCQQFSANWAWSASGVRPLPTILG
jgi:hypothetical protein